MRVARPRILRRQLADARMDATADVVVYRRGKLGIKLVDNARQFAAHCGNLPLDRIANEPPAYSRTLESADDLSGRNPPELELAIELHRHLLTYLGID